jgi:ankyrin repeat protein
MNNYKLIFTLSILLFMSGCTTAPSSKSPPKPTTKQMIYEACMPSAERKAKKDGKEDPKLVAHYFCQIVAGICAKTPEEDSCQRVLIKYELELNKQGVSLLFNAAKFGDHRLVEAMINAGVNVDYSITGITNTQFGAGWTPLMIAVAEGNEEVVSVLIKSGANVNAKNKLGRTSLMFASKYGFYSIAKMLLENNANTDEIPNDKDGWTAIIAAVYEGHDDIVNLLISHGADTKIQDKNGKTALMWAENQGNTKIVELLKATR